MICCRDLTVRRGALTVLDGVTFTVAPGDFVAVVGANGAGKTTLLHSLLGFLRPASGSVDVSVGGAGRGRSIGYIPQHARDAMHLPIRVCDVVAIGRCGFTPPGRRLGAADRAAIQAAMASVRIAHLADRPIDAVSGGERQRVQLARVLAQEAQLLLLDEPAANLDLGGRCEILDLVSALRETRPLTVVMVMHELAYLPAACRRALVLDRGRLAWDGAMRAVFEPGLLGLIYGENATRVRKELHLC